MKRALAERYAKESLSAAVTSAKEQQHHERNTISTPQHPSAVQAAKSTTTGTSTAPVGSSTTTTTGVPLQNGHSTAETKIPRIEKPPVSVELQRTSTSPQSSPRPKKKMKASQATAPRQKSNTGGTTAAAAAADNSDEDDNNGGAFYLKHQNRALATELKSLQFAVQQLEAERDVRRQHCRSATQSVLQLGTVWTAVEQAALKTTAVASFPTPSTTTSTTTSSADTNGMDPPSTGTGDSVEWTRALQNSLAALGQTSKSAAAASDTAAAAPHATYTDTLEQATLNIAARAKILQEWLGTVLKSGSLAASTATKTTTSLDDGDSSNQTAQHAQQLQALKREMGDVTSQCAQLEAQVSELAASRQEAALRERRVRRNVYRMAAGMLSAEQVVNTLERGQGDEVEAAVELEKQQVKMENDAAKIPIKQEQDDATQDVVSSAIVEELNTKIANLEASVSGAENAIQDLNTLLNEKERRITELSKKQRTDEDSKKLESLETTLLQLKSSRANASELQSKLNRTETKWSHALGNERAALAAVDELISKFNKRWSEFTNQSTPAPVAIKSEGDAMDLDGKIVAPLPEDSPQVVQAKQIAMLQHKLDQALENVRQSETTRDNLKVALSMNSSLQGKLDEVKSKYAQVQASRSSEIGKRAPSSHSSSAAASAPSAAPPSKESEAEQKEKAERSDKYRREYRKARTELAAMQVSKDATKAKYERAEKERESLAESNVRLLKQIGEKDDMNAKSLSTILHLKSMTEKLTKERDNLEQQAKSASQLALAARLATNAKERVSEEVLKESKELEGRMEELEKKYQSTKDELERVSAEWSESSGQMAVKGTELANALKRSDELVLENEQKRDEIRRLMNVVSKSQREARDAKDKLASAMKSGIAVGSDTAAPSEGNFSVDQLKTQISVLKTRLACPVCHYRDKECIILRCRHMHCKQCVDERISNRSRKCPTCNIKFSENDVGDIWLN